MEEKYKEDQTDQLKDVIEELGPINTNARTIACANPSPVIEELGPINTEPD